MPTSRTRDKLYPFFTIGRAWSAITGPRGLGTDMLVAGAAAIFIALFGWGSSYFGWSDPDGKVQLALATAFVLGIVAGYKTNG